MALVPVLALGTVAQAAPAPWKPTSASVSQDRPGHVIAKGEISRIGHIQTPEGPVVGFKFGEDGPWWLADKDTLVLKDGEAVDPRALEAGDFVFAEGTQDEEFVTATRVTVN